jgi:hypothetical protein
MSKLSSDKNKGKTNTSNETIIDLHENKAETLNNMSH